MSGDALSQLGIPSPFERGLLLGKKLYRQFSKSFIHEGDGVTHYAPMPDDCEICDSIVGLRFSLLNGEPTDEQLAVIVDAVQQAQPQQETVSPRRQKDKTALLADLLWESPAKTLEELVEQSGCSRATVFRLIEKIGASKVPGTGVGRTPARYQAVVVSQSRE